MRRHPSDVDHPGDSPGPTRRRRPWWGRLGRLTGFAMLTLVVLLIVSTVLNYGLVQYERSTAEPYGERVEIGNGSVNVVDNGRDGPTVVLLSGLGTPAPAPDFGPLVRELGDYRVVVVEGFGYGYSDLTAPERTVQNVSEELHAALAATGVEEPYVLAGHSLAGFYILDYVNRYPGEVSAVVGIDTTVPAVVEDDDGTAAEDGRGIPWERLPSITGLLRWVLLVAPDLALPEGTAHTAEERDRILRMTVWNNANAAVTDETRRMGDNARDLEGVGFPAELPVLLLLAQDTMDQMPEWLPRHEEQLRGVRDHELVVLDGGHYLHWTRSPEIAATATGFLERHGVVRREGSGLTTPSPAG
ncbi:alpha/beta fold hydrolase [Kocuria dechangensis]|nr:alpha/beta hydrolase [Kocuria dechangensis]